MQYLCRMQGKSENYVEQQGTGENYTEAQETHKSLFFR